MSRRCSPAVSRGETSAQAAPASIAGAEDALLAEYFNVPLEQIAEKRLDLLAVERI